MSIPNLKDPIDQIEFLGAEIDFFVKQATVWCYKREVLPRPVHGYVVTAQARQSNELIVMTKNGRVVEIL